MSLKDLLINNANKKNLDIYCDSASVAGNLAVTGTSSVTGVSTMGTVNANILNATNGATIVKDGDIAVRSNRTQSATSGAYCSLQTKVISDGEISDGFGACFQFAYEDATSGEIAIANLEAVRNGADNTSKIVMKGLNAGSSQERLNMTETEINLLLPVNINAAAKVTQITGISNPVTQNGSSGQIETVSSTLAGGANTTPPFTLNNSAIKATSVIVGSVIDYSGTYGTNGIPQVLFQNISNGTVEVSLFNAHASNALSGTVTISYIVST